MSSVSKMPSCPAAAASPPSAATSTTSNPRLLSMSRKRLLQKKLQTKCPHFLKAIQEGEMQQVIELLGRQQMKLSDFLGLDRSKPLVGMLETKYPLFWKAYSSGHVTLAFQIIKERRALQEPKRIPSLKELVIQ